MIIINRSERYFLTREQEMTPLHIVVTKQKEAKSLLPVRHVAKHNFSQGASTFSKG